MFGSNRLRKREFSRRFIYLASPARAAKLFPRTSTIEPALKLEKKQKSWCFFFYKAKNAALLKHFAVIIFSRPRTQIWFDIMIYLMSNWML